MAVKLVRWGLRLLAIGMVVAAVVLVTTMPAPSGATCSLSPWTYWWHGGFTGPPHPPISVLDAQHIEGCISLISDRWHIAWGLSLGGVLLLVASLLPGRVFSRARRHDPGPALT